MCVPSGNLGASTTWLRGEGRKAAPTIPDVPAGTIVEVSGIALEAWRDTRHPRGQLACCCSGREDGRGRGGLLCRKCWGGEAGYRTAQTPGTLVGVAADRLPGHPLQQMRSTAAEESTEWQAIRFLLAEQDEQERKASGERPRVSSLGFVAVQDDYALSQLSLCSVSSAECHPSC